MKKKAKKKAKPKAKAKKVKRAKPRSQKRSKPKKAKKTARSKAQKKAATAKPKMTVIPPPNSVLVGRVEDYFAHIGVIAFTVKKPIRVGDHLHLMGHTTNLEQTVDSMQIDHQPVNEAQPNDAVGIKVGNRARRGDYIFLLQG